MMVLYHDVMLAVPLFCDRFVVPLYRGRPVL